MVKSYDISSYAILKFNDSVGTVSDVVVSKGQRIYKQLFDTALLSFIKHNYPQYNSINEFKQDFIIVENPKLDFNSPPKSLSIRNKNDITTSINVDLTEFWPNYVYSDYDSNSIIMIDPNSIVANYELIDIDYIRNIAIMKNKENGIKYCIELNKINKNTPLSDSFIRNTFTDIYNG